MNVKDWLSENFSVQSIKKGEYLLVCPVCSKPKLYFNIYKKIGYCHYAGCTYHTNGCSLRDLVEYSQGWPVFEDSYGGNDSIPISGDLPSRTVLLPKGSRQLVSLSNGEYIPQLPVISSKVSERGVSVQDQYRFDICFGLGRVIIPIYHEGVMVQWIGRLPWWMGKTSKMKYLYADGSKVGNFLFNYDEIKTKPYMTLVENTYNAIWLRDVLNTTSIFGSNLTDEQVKLISKSSAKKVLIMFDEGAEIKAEQALNKLNNSGIDASIIKISGQPDNHTKEYLRHVGTNHI